MKTINLVLTFLIVTSFAFGQVAVIKDKDGFTNVRNEANGESEVIYKMFDNFVYQMNSDGAGAYQIVWVFTKENGLIQKLVGTMI